MKILVINTGSSSIKHRLFEMAEGRLLASGLLERIGEPGGRLVMGAGPGRAERVVETLVPDHRAGMEMIIAALTDPAAGVIRSAAEIGAVGHRVVHGGERFTAPALIDDEVIQAIRDHIPLAPLHNPANLDGIAAARALFPGTPQVAVFDTAFHQTMPPCAFHYALPGQLYEQHRIRRYGFHGTSHQYVAEQAALLLDRPLAFLNLITIHLGNGSSMTAVEAGRSVDTSMGLTPLEGLVMGTRSGDIDPSIIFHLADRAGLGLAEIADLLNRESGLKGLTGHNDLREVIDRAGRGDRRARLGLEIYTYRIKKYLGAYWAVLGRVDAVVFTGGVGENAVPVRAAVGDGLERLGIVIDPVANRSPETGPREISAAGSAVKVLVIPTNEELAIALQTLRVAGAGLPGPGP